MVTGGAPKAPVIYSPSSCMTTSCFSLCEFPRCLYPDCYAHFCFRAFIAYLATAVVWLTAGVQYFLIPAVINSAFTTNMGSRFILNLCSAYHHPVDSQNGDAQNTIFSMEGIRFARYSADGGTRLSTSSRRHDTMAV